MTDYESLDHLISKETLPLKKRIEELTQELAEALAKEERVMSRIITVTAAELAKIHELERKCQALSPDGEWRCDEAKWQAGLEEILGRELVAEMLLHEGRTEFQVRVMEWDRE